ncbi:Disease resistance protein (CC-NBS-LRR class) family [Rhynchospora pubera]|uniref:Disease resistance protein (CC-NBS-LRR class) family n=1 Tax=Rhynchospora pubera TaxID=906938 RepID=A0AAV8BQC9_9POAL|nr:Disease resistance protein (CC-NBS-LRR class) family [Rhynchospora pubera]
MDWSECFRETVKVVPLVASMPHMVYPFTFGSNVRTMQLANKRLKNLKKDVEIQIENARGINDTPTHEVLGWLDQVEIIIKEAEDIVEEYQQLFRCIWNISPNLYSNYNISKRAVKNLDDAKDLWQEKLTIQVISKQLPQGQQMPASSSKSSYLESVLNGVKADENIIGIWGMGGVGKTHLLEQINNALCEEPRNNLASKVFVVFVTCSKEYHEENIQNTIIEKLGLNKSDNREVKQLTIYNFLREKSFVLLLDNLWRSVDLKAIGIPNIKEAVRYKRKVVLTTRLEKVCRIMGVEKKVKLDILEWEAAWSLFEKNVSKETIDSDPQIRKCAMDVAKKLGGLPLALITVGKAMRDKKDLSEWEVAVKQLKKIRLRDVEVSDEYTSVFKMLSFSYDSLENEKLKQCFIHCSLWPEGHIIEKDDLVELWMGLGLIDMPTFEDAYNVGYSYIGALQTVSLLEIVDDKFTKMHDVIHDMALWIANDKKEVMNKWIVGASTYQRGQQIVISSDTEIVSVPYEVGTSFFIADTSTKLATFRGIYNEG